MCFPPKKEMGPPRRTAPVRVHGARATMLRVAVQVPGGIAAELLMASCSVSVCEPTKLVLLLVKVCWPRFGQKKPVTPNWTTDASEHGAAAPALTAPVII